MVSIIILCITLAAGHLLRTKIRLLQRLYLPSCVIAGILALIIIQTFAYLDHITIFRNANIRIVQWTVIWPKLPSMLINIVFACLFLGIKLPKLSTLWNHAGPQIAYGQIVAWGQYVVGLGLWVILLGWMFPELPDTFGAILPVGFEGGHGTAAGMGPVFADLGWPEGQDFALASATFGIVFAIIVGMIMINIAVRKGLVKQKKDPADFPEDDTIAVIPVDRRPSAGKLTVSSDAIESFTLHLVFVAIAIGIGFLLKELLLVTQSLSPYLTKHKLLSSFPLFPLCMIGGIIVQMWEEKFDKHKLIDLGLIRRIQNSSLDFLVVAAIAMIKTNVILDGIIPLTILVAAGIAWNVFCVWYLARRFLPDAWFERAIAEMGQSMGVTATGLLLLRVVDPDYETPAADAFACKQIVHEPFMGGGIWTSAAIPLIAIYGPAKILVIAVAALTFWIATSITLRKLRK